MCYRCARESEAATMPVKFKDYYATLGVSRGASAEELKKAYRKLARQHHPDVNKAPGAEARFKEVNEAYEVLGDPEKRKRYDALGANWRGGQEFTPPPGWENIRFDFGGGQGGPGGGFAFEDLGGGAGGFSDFFEMLFGGGRGAGGGRDRSFRYRTSRFGGAPEEDFAPEGGQDHEAALTVSLDDVFRGATKSIALQGESYDPEGRPRRAVKNYDVKIPVGATEGTRIRLAGQGAASPYGGPPGNLYLTLHVAPHPLFKVSGHDLDLELPLAPWEAALGGQVTIPALGGAGTLTVPPGTASGQRLRLRGQGLPKPGGRGAGDLYVVAKLVLPPKLTARERSLLEELARVSAFRARNW